MSREISVNQAKSVISEQRENNIIKSLANIYIDPNAVDTPLVKRLMAKKFAGSIISLHRDQKQDGLGQLIKDQIQLSEDPYLEGKKTLYISASKGGFFNHCPGTKNLLCCNYFIINPISGCNLDCQYCFLQGYLDSPLITVTANYNDHLQQLATWLRQRSKHFFRIGSGELSDSLSLDPLLEMARDFISFFSQFDNCQLELKTKSNYVHHLLDIKDKGKTIISFSLNPQKIIDAYEYGTATLEERLLAAKEAWSHGYQCAFHFDPIFYFPGWQQQYQQAIDQLFSLIPGKAIAYISLGVMRYFKNLKETIYRRFPQSDIMVGPFTQSGEEKAGGDEKWRYYRPIREQIYRQISAMILAKDGAQWIYFCMEGTKTWRRVFNLEIDNQKNLDAYFTKRRLDNQAILHSLPTSCNCAPGDCSA